MINLFLAKPFGAKNLLQHMLVEAADLPKTEKSIKEMKNIINNKKIVGKVLNWVTKNYIPEAFKPSNDEFMDDSVASLEKELQRNDDPVGFVTKILR